ncbi:MAG: nuclear transport factor 2 family protein [Bacteroidetes bacterium]|nr:nuclear transport factor 2 family protein [Bacteroidota bacterium]
MWSCQTSNPTKDEAELKQLVTTFLDSVDSAKMHDRFWAEDLIYTSSAGKRFGKEQIMSGFSSNSDSTSSRAESKGSPYSAENMQIQLWGDVAVVAFQLVNKDGESVTEYLNSGTFVKRNGEWKVVNWQSTKKADVLRSAL